MSAAATARHGECELLNEGDSPITFLMNADVYLLEVLMMAVLVPFEWSPLCDHLSKGGCVFNFHIKNPEIQPTSPLALAGAVVAAPAAGLVEMNVLVFCIAPGSRSACMKWP